MTARFSCCHYNRWKRQFCHFASSGSENIHESITLIHIVEYNLVKSIETEYCQLVLVWKPDFYFFNPLSLFQFDGIHVVSGSLDTSIRVWDVETGNCIHTLTGHQSLTSGMELKDNILVSGNADSTVKIWDIKTGQCLQTLQGEPRLGVAEPECVFLHQKTHRKINTCTLAAFV